MDENSFIVREPLIDVGGAVAGYELSMQSDGGLVSLANCAPSATIPSYVASLFRDGAPGQFGESVVVLAVRPQWIGPPELSVMPPRRSIFRFGGADLTTDASQLAVKALRKRDFGVMIRDPQALMADERLAALATHIEFDYTAADVEAQVEALGEAKQGITKLVARNVSSWAALDHCAKMGVQAFVGNLHLTPRTAGKQRGLNPTQAIILQMMELVSQNAEIRQLESVLKRDLTITYKLLRYINSVGFSLGAEIQSLRHAVTMLGYSPLYRWLSLLLATSSTVGYSPSLMQAAVIRGRFVELLGKGNLPKMEAENLFVTGMFSLLDRLLGIPMEEVLQTIQLASPVKQALLERGGMYGPFLALAEACELHNGYVGQLAESLLIDAPKVNEAHLAAISWAQSLHL